MAKTNDGISIKGAGTKGSYHVDEDTKDMSVDHLKDTFNFNLKHAEDHLEKAREVCHKLVAAGQDDEVDVSKTLLDLFAYFEKAEGSDNAAKMPMDKLRNKLKDASEEY
jgi:hypothetical protein